MTRASLRSPRRSGRSRVVARKYARRAIVAATDSPASAKAAGLHYVNDQGPGIRRKRRGRGFVYLDARSKPVSAPETLRRIRSLVIPPAWTDVWICSREDGHLQATGRDAKHRKQYRYHPRWAEVRDETKFDRMLSFGDALPAIRAQVERDLALAGLPRAKVLATVVRLLDRTLIRIGNGEYARKNDSYGLTTLREDHVDVSGSRIRFHFRGKAGKEHSVELKDERLAKIVRRCQAIPGHELFQYLDDEGKPCLVESSDVNDYLRSITGDEFTAKDFRTWAGTVLAMSALRECLPCTSQSQTKKQLVAAIRSVAERLGNTPTVCRKCYVHPVVVEAFLRQTLGQLSPSKRGRHRGNGLEPGETLTLALLRDAPRPQSA